MARGGLRQASFPFLPATAIAQAQARHVRAAVAHAHAHVPYYRETMRRLGLGPGDVATAHDLALLPILERADVQGDPEYFLSDLWPADSCVTLQSGGTTGEPLTVFRDPPSLLVESAHRERQRSLVARLAGRRLRYREAMIVPHDSSVGTAVRAVRRFSLLPPGLRVQRRTYSMLRPPSELVPELDAYRPDVISSYGSYLEALFAYLGDRPGSLGLPRVVLFAGDDMASGVRHWVRETLGVEVLGSYNAIETPQIGFECECHRGYHLNVDICPLRTVNANGSALPVGEEGEVVVSNLLNRGTVLLNYRLGDLVTRLDESCPCGRRLPLSSYVGARATHWLYLGAERRVHPQALRLILRGERAIWRYQLVQQSRHRLALRLVPRRDCDRAAVARRLAERFREQLGDGVDVQVEYVEDLPRGASSKVQPIVALPPPVAATIEARSD